MWIKNDVYEIHFNRSPWWTKKKGLLINILEYSGQILCQKGSFYELIDFLDDKIHGETIDLVNGETINLAYNNILPKDKSKLLSFFKGIEAYGKKDGSKLSTEDLDIISENFADIFLNKKAYVKRVYNYLTKEK